MISALALARLEAALLTASPDESLVGDAQAYALGRTLCLALADTPPPPAPETSTVLPDGSRARPCPVTGARVWQQQLITALSRACAEPDPDRRLRLRARALVRTLRLLERLPAGPALPPEALEAACTLYNHLDMVCRGQRAAATTPEARRGVRPLLAALRAA